MSQAGDMTEILLTGTLHPYLNQTKGLHSSNVGCTFCKVLFLSLSCGYTISSPCEHNGSGELKMGPGVYTSIQICIQRSMLAWWLVHHTLVRESIPTGSWLTSLHDEQGTLTLESTG